MNRPPDLMFPFVGGRRRMKGICFTVVATVALLHGMIGAVLVSAVVLLPALVLGIPFLLVGIDCLRPSVLIVREIDILIAWSPRSHKQWLLPGISRAQATRERIRLTYEANPTLPLDLTLEACDFTAAAWWPLISAILDRATRMNPDMTISLSADLAALPALTAGDLASFRHASC